MKVTTANMQETYAVIFTTTRQLPMPQEYTETSRRML